MEAILIYLVAYSSSFGKFLLHQEEISTNKIGLLSGEWGDVIPHLPTKYTKAFLFSWIYLKKLLYFVEVVVYPVHLPSLPRVFSQSFFLFVPQEKILTLKLATSPPENNGLG